MIAVSYYIILIGHGINNKSQQVDRVKAHHFIIIRALTFTEMK